MGLVAPLRMVRDVASLMNKDYTQVCDGCLVEWWHLRRCHHCPRCHESFKTKKLLEMHIHPRTGGCRHPGSIEGFFSVTYVPDHTVWMYRKPEKARR